MGTNMKAEIEQERTPGGKLKTDQYEILLSEDGVSSLRYLRLSAKELDAITEAWAVRRLTVGDAGVSRQIEARRTGGEQLALEE